jgi:hypothetical protein
LPSRRVPGPLGLASDAFPEPNWPWEEWPRSPALPAGAAADAHYEVEPVGLDYEPIDADGDGEGEDESSAPIERFRYMEVQGETVKVRCVPLWQGRMLGMLGAAENDEKAQDKLVRAVKSHKPETRANMVTFLTQQLNAEGKGGSPVAGKLAQIKLAPVGEDGPEEGAGVAGRMAGALPAVQRGRRLVNG